MFLFSESSDDNEQEIRESITLKTFVKEVDSKISHSVFNITFDAKDPDQNLTNAKVDVWQDPRLQRVWREVTPFEPMQKLKALPQKFNYFEASYRVILDNEFNDMCSSNFSCATIFLTATYVLYFLSGNTFIFENMRYYLK